MVRACLKFKQRTAQLTDYSPYYLSLKRDCHGSLTLVTFRANTTVTYIVRSSSTASPPPHPFRPYPCALSHYRSQVDEFCHAGLRQAEASGLALKSDASYESVMLVAVIMDAVKAKPMKRIRLRPAVMAMFIAPAKKSAILAIAMAITSSRRRSRIVASVG